MRPLPLATALVLTVAATTLGPSAEAGADGFWPTWSDGKAELDAYHLVQPRYGAPREGYAVYIYVTEEFSDSLRVKADPGKHPRSDVYPVLKLNAVRHFQTGIYDYSVMSSTFLRTEPVLAEGPFSVVKISLSVQEWCGHVYAQWLRRGARLVETSHSYFDGEADAEAQLDLPEGAILEEQLPVLLRGLRGAFLAPGQSRVAPFLPAALYARFAHRRQRFGRVTLARAAAPGRVDLRVGARKLEVEAEVYTAVEEGGATTTYYVEPSGARRLLGWVRSDGERATLLGSERLPYWELNGVGGEAALDKLGLRPLFR